jgi:acetylornithine/succinyldiaminopimelate/putrescine aminotransferase
MASDAADALAKTYARNKKLLSFRSITNGLQQTGLLVAYTHRASVHFDPPLSAQRSAYLDQADAMIKNPVT